MMPIIPMVSNLSSVLSLLTALGLGAIIVEAIRSVSQRKKMGADYADVISSSAVRLLAPLENRIKELEAQVADIKGELDNAVTELRQERHLREDAEREIIELRGGK
jgi:peptidoglycan hydrolase CwlO-like protein